MKILDRLPIYEEPSLIDVWGEVLEIYRNQIIIWVSLAETSRPFPALLDTGHSHNFSIPRRQLERWGRTNLKQIGESKVGTRVIPQCESELFIHANEPGKRRLTGRKHRLEMSEGVSVVPDDVPLRLPLIGLRALIHNDVDLIIRSKKRQVTLKTNGWL